jgi:hypothetical protein
MAEKRPPKMVARKASDQRTGDNAKRPRKVAKAKPYKPPMLPPVVKKTAGRPKKAS